MADFKKIANDQIEDIPASKVSDFDTEVANNPDVAANTAKTGVTTQISNVVEDTTPQLGGNLDLNSNNVGDADAADLTKLSEVTATSTELNFIEDTIAFTTSSEGSDAFTSLLPSIVV